MCICVVITETNSMIIFLHVQVKNPPYAWFLHQPPVPRTHSACIVFYIGVQRWDLYGISKVIIENTSLVIGVFLTHLGYNSLLLYIGLWVGVCDALPHF